MGRARAVAGIRGYGRLCKSQSYDYERFVSARRIGLHRTHTFHLTLTGDYASLPTLVCVRCTVGPPQQAPEASLSRLEVQRAAQKCGELLGRHSGVHPRVVYQRRGQQLIEELHHKVVLIRAPVDLEGHVDQALALRDELGPREAGLVNKMAVVDGLIDPRERHASRRAPEHDHAALDDQIVLLVAVEVRWVRDEALGEGHVDVRDLSPNLWEDVRGRVRAVRSASKLDSLDAMTNRGSGHSSLVGDAAMPGAL